MPTTRSGTRYGPGDTKSTTAGKQALPNKRKAVVKTYAKAKSQSSRTKPTLKVKQDAGMKKAAQYKKPPIKASSARGQKASRIQAAKRSRVESVDKRRFRGPRSHSDLTNEQSEIHITWQPCAVKPTRFYFRDVTVISGRVYCGGGGATDDVYDEDDYYIVYCYSLSQDKWTTLPPLPAKLFGLGQVNGELVAIGGEMRHGLTNAVNTYDERSHKWKRIISPMPTARSVPSVLSLQSALVVAGGCSRGYISTVEIFKPDTSLWYRTDPLPTACCDKFLGAIGNTCYVLGGFNDSFLNQALYASIDDLLGNAVPANQTTHSGSSDTKSAWKTLPNTPTYEPAAAVVAGNLLAIGGNEISIGGAYKKEVYMYSPSTNSWIYISGLPAPRSGAAVAVLSSTEILVIGGYESAGNYMDTVYKGILASYQI